MQQAADVVLQLQQAGQVGVFGDFTFDRTGVEFQLAFAALGEVTDAAAFAEVIAGITAAEYQQEQQQDQQQNTGKARFHGQGWRHAVSKGGGALHHSPPWLGSCAGLNA